MNREPHQKPGLQRCRVRLVTKSEQATVANRKVRTTADNQAGFHTLVCRSPAVDDSKRTAVGFGPMLSQIILAASWATQCRSHVSA